MPQVLDLKEEFGVTISGVPDTEDLNAPSPELLAFANNAIKTGSASYKYGDPAPVKLKEAADQSIAQQEQEPAPKTTFKGAVDSFIRNVAPTAVAAAFSLPLAAAERVAYHLSEPIANLLNEKLNLTGTKWEQMNSQEMYDTVHDWLSVERADTDVEKLAGAAGTGIAEGIGMTSAAGMMQAGAPVLGKGNLLQESGKALADAPTRELLSSTGAEVGAEGGRQIAENTEMGKFGQVALPLAMGAAGGGLGVGIDAFMNRHARRSIAKGMDLPEQTAEKIALGESRNVPVMRSDVMPPENIGWREMQRQKLGEGLPFGTGDPRVKQYNAVKDAVYDELADYGLDENTVKALPAYDSPLLDDFLKVRGDKLSSNVDIKKEVIERLSGDKVPVQSASDFLDTELAKLVDIDTNVSKKLRSKLTEWKGAIENNDLGNLEEVRKDLFEELKSADNESIRRRGTDILNGAYAKINENMGEFIKINGNPEDFANWKGANLELAKLSDEFGNVALEEVIEQASKGNLNPDMMRPEAISDMLFSKDASEVERLYNRLSVDGKAVARTSVMHEIASGAMDDFGKMSPRQFGVELSNKAAQRGILLDENQRQSLTGLKELIDLTGRSDTVFKGVGGTPVSGSMWKNIATAFTSGDILLSAGGMARLYETPKFRNMLVNLAEIPNTRAGATERAELAKRAIDLIKTYSDPEKTEEETAEAVQVPEETATRRQ